MVLLFSAILVMSFLTIFLFVIGLRARTESQMIHERLQEFTVLQEPVSNVLDREFQKSFGERILKPLLDQILGAIIRMTPAGAAAAAQAKLDAAGNPTNIGVREFFALRFLAAALAVAASFFVFRATRNMMPLPAAFFTTVLCLVIFALLPDYLLQQRINIRQMKIRKSLPDIIDLLLVSVEAGLGFDAAMQQVVEKVKGPLPEEFARVLQEMRLGKLRAQALRDMARRAGVEELSTFVAAIYQADQLGVSISKVLHVQGETLRTRRVQKIREMAAKLPVKMLFPLVFFIFPAIFVVILAPGMISIMQALGSIGR